MKKLRLLLFKDCNRNCAGCCNKDWDTDSLPQIQDNDFKNYSTVMLTGGEPLLNPSILFRTIKRVREHTTAKIIVYTAETRCKYTILYLLQIIDGITLTLHSSKDIKSFIELNNLLLQNKELIKDKSLRLNIFKEVNFHPEDENDFNLWVIKNNMVWIRNCPLPEGEEFKKI